MALVSAEIYVRLRKNSKPHLSDVRRVGSASGEEVAVASAAIRTCPKT